jgi:hypothetical protein
MADTENTPTAHETAASAIDFDTWRQAINASMESYRKYLGLSKGKPYSLPIVAEEIGAEFPELVNHLLEGIDPASPMAMWIGNSTQASRNGMPSLNAALRFVICSRTMCRASKHRRITRMWIFNGFLSNHTLTR